MHAYALADGTATTVEVRLPDGGIGPTFEVKRSGSVVTIDAHGATKTWRFMLAGIHSVAEVEGGDAVNVAVGDAIDGAEGTLVTPATPASSLHIRLG